MEARAIEQFRQWGVFSHNSSDGNPFERTPEDAHGDIVMMMMAGGDEEEYYRIRDERPYSESWRLHALRAATFYRPK